MKSYRSSLVKAPTKSPAGITGFDEIAGGGLPRGQTKLLLGGPGSGKTIFALQFPVHGAQDRKDPGIIIPFEESSKRIVANAECLSWKLAGLQRKKWYFLNAQPTLIETQRRWHDVTSGREGRILELKHEVHDLLSQTDKHPRYPSAESQGPIEE